MLPEEIVTDKIRPAVACDHLACWTERIRRERFCTVFGNFSPVISLPVKDWIYARIDLIVVTYETAQLHEILHRHFARYVYCGNIVLIPEIAQLASEIRTGDGMADGIRFDLILFGTAKVQQKGNPPVGFEEPIGELDAFEHPFERSSLLDHSSAATDETFPAALGQIVVDVENGTAIHAVCTSHREHFVGIHDQLRQADHLLPSFVHRKPGGFIRDVDHVEEAGEYLIHAVAITCRRAEIDAGGEGREIGEDRHVVVLIAVPVKPPNVDEYGNPERGHHTQCLLLEDKACSARYFRTISALLMVSWMIPQIV